jgi:hypothetical protein
VADAAYEEVEEPADQSSLVLVSNNERHPVQRHEDRRVSVNEILVRAGEET